MTKFGEKEGSATLSDLDPKADKETGSGEHSDILSGTLKCDRDQTKLAKKKVSYMMMAPVMIPQRRPNLSAMTGKMGIATTEPTA
jgi:hypothetical protein